MKVNRAPVVLDASRLRFAGEGAGRLLLDPRQCGHAAPATLMKARRDALFIKESLAPAHVGNVVESEDCTDVLRARALTAARHDVGSHEVLQGHRYRQLFPRVLPSPTAEMLLSARPIGPRDANPDTSAHFSERGVTTMLRLPTRTSDMKASS